MHKTRFIIRDGALLFPGQLSNDAWDVRFSADFRDVRPTTTFCVLNAYRKTGKTTTFINVPLWQFRRGGVLSEYLLFEYYAWTRRSLLNRPTPPNQVGSYERLTLKKTTVIDDVSEKEILSTLSDGIFEKIFSIEIYKTSGRRLRAIVSAISPNDLVLKTCEKNSKPTRPKGDERCQLPTPTRERVANDWSHAN